MPTFVDGLSPPTLLNGESPLDTTEIDSLLATLGVEMLAGGKA